MFTLFNKKQKKTEEMVLALEEKVTRLEEKVAWMENHASKSLKNEIKTQQAESDKNKKREKHIAAIMKKSGWTREETIAKVRNAANILGITYEKFDKYNFHAVQEEAYQEEYAKKEKAARKKDRKRQKQEQLIQQVMENTGWNRETAKERMDKSQKLCGAEYKDYVAYRFWELDDEVQATYFTKGDANALRKKYNTSTENTRIFMDKDRFDEVFADCLGRPWAATARMTLEEFRETFAEENKIIYKPLSDSCGHGITTFDLSEENMEEVFHSLKALPEGVVEGYIIQHPEMSKFSLRSVNTVRIVSVRAFGDVNILYAAFRMGGGDSVVDNFHAGGVLALIDTETGIVNTQAIDLAANPYERHPVTNEQIVGFQIPYWDQIVALIKKAGTVVEGVGYVGWDVAVSENGPVLIEGNTAPAPNVLQTPYAKAHQGMKHVVKKYL